MNEVLKYLLKSNKSLVPEERLNEIFNMSLYDWQTFADEVKCKGIYVYLLSYNYCLYQMKVFLFF